MADIDLERKSGPGVWPWLLGLVLLGAVIWGVAEAMDGDEYETAAVTEMETSPAEADVELGQPAPATDAGMTLAAILAQPTTYVGRTFSGGTYSVADVPTDRGFWIERNGDRLFALIIDQPVEEPKDINPGQTLDITGGTLRGPEYLSQVTGDDLDADTRAIAEELDVYLVVDESNLTITETGND